MGDNNRFTVGRVDGSRHDITKLPLKFGIGVIRPALPDQVVVQSSRFSGMGCQRQDTRRAYKS